MSRASTERDEAVETMMLGVVLNAFTQYEKDQMLMEAFKRMTVTELEQLVAEHTSYPSVMDVEVVVG